MYLRLNPIICFVTAIIVISGCCTQTHVGEEEIKDQENEHWRWNVKTLTDPDTSWLRGSGLYPQQSMTISRLIDLDPPTDLEGKEMRSREEEKFVVVRGIIIRYDKEKDGDIHLVFSDNDDNTIIAEVPDPDSLKGVYAQASREVREWLRGKLGQPSPKAHPHLQVELDGIVFFDEKHRQKGVAPNGVELHPVLGIRE